MAQCNYTISSADGARLTGAGFGSTVPTLTSGESLSVVVQWSPQSPPATLKGYMIISPAANVPNQTVPSPFVQSNGQPLCYKSWTVSRQNNAYTFGGLTYAGGKAGKYEMTFVAEHPTQGTQWSEDPEFDTSQ